MRVPPRDAKQWKGANVDQAYKDETCAQFASDLAAKSSVPGGGAAAAYAGAMGAALAQMVGNFTLGKKKYAEFEDDVERINARAASLQERLVELVDEDAESFRPLAAAYAIPKEDPSREEAIQLATAKAAECPMRVMRLCCEAVGLLEELEAKGSHMLMSDVGCGAALCRGALEAAAMNVYVNTAALSDRKVADALDGECAGMLGEYAPRAAKVAESVMRGLRRS